MTGRKRFATIMMCFIPLIAAEVIQFLMIIPVAGILSLNTFRNHTEATYEELVTALTDALTSVGASSAVSLLYATATIAIFGFWFLKQFRTDSLYPPKQAFHPVLLIGLVFAAPGWQVLANYIVELTSTISPHSLEVYEKIMESAGFDDMTFALILYAVLLGPICEELLFRGVTMSLAKKAMPFWLANLFQALLFGIFHMNVIQGVYAFVLGIFMGYICEKGGNILISICFHILYNACATFAPDWFLSGADESTLYFFLWLAAGVLFAGVGALLFTIGVRKRNEKVNLSGISADI